MVITSAETEQVGMVSLRHGTAAASLGADDDLEYLVTRVRAAWPNVRFHVRGDGGFGNPTMYEITQAVRPWPTFGPDEAIDKSSTRVGVRGPCAVAGGRLLYEV